MHPLRDNPFFVLALPVTATALEVERQGRKWLAMLELDLPSARTYATPLGRRLRTPDAVRAAMRALNDPAQRPTFEPWAAAGAALAVDSGDGGNGDDGAGDDRYERDDAGLDPRGMTWWDR
ncbi:MAG: hypothetical protein FJ137_06015 [Deltaproteobacteria bacterium]|nr:hypothetical protein [Deltaproteobacteria bacterium]